MDAHRQKALDRAVKFHRQATSSNKHESDVANKRLAEICAKHDISLKEITDTIDAEEHPVVRRVGGSVKAKGDWEERVALGVAKRWGCKPLRGDNQVVFEGSQAVSAVAEYRRIVLEINEAQERCWRSYDHKYRLTMVDTHRRRFTDAAAEMTIQFATTLGEDHHTLQMGFADEGRKEARAIMKRLALERIETK